MLIKVMDAREKNVRFFDFDHSMFGEKIASCMPPYIVSTSLYVGN